jgi:tungstate transport system ATP-binding protein
MTPLLAIKGLSKTYAGRPVLAADELEFEPGRITAVWGANGAGKSTLLRIVALLDYPDRGEIFFHGRPLTDRGDWFTARRAITLVDQKPYAFPGTVSHNTAYGLALRRTPAAEARDRVAGALAAVDLAGFERRRARTLSGGELQRLAIARAIVIAPELLLLDEPTAHVDAARVRIVEDLILRLRAERGLTIVLATHDPDQAGRIADRVLRIDNGQLQTQPARILAARLRRENGRLIITPAENAPSAAPSAAGLQPASAIVSLELAGDAVIIAVPGLRIRVPRADLAPAAPLLGEPVEFTGPASA